MAGWKRLHDATETTVAIKARYRGYGDGFASKSRAMVAKLADRSLLERYDAIVSDDAIPASALACSHPTRRLLRESFCDEMLQFRRENPKIQLYLGTMFHSPWRSDLDVTVVEKGDFTSRTHKVFEDCEFLGTQLFGEIQVAQDPIDRSLWIWLHSHFLVAAEPGFQPQCTSNRINDGFRLQSFNNLGCLQISNKLVHEADVARAANYILKEPYSGKDINPNTGRPESSTRMMTPAVCLRLIEILSSLSFFDLSIATGCFKPMKHQLLAQLGPAHQVRRETSRSMAEAQDLFSALRQRGLPDGNVTVNRGRLPDTPGATPAGTMLVERHARWTGVAQARPKRARSMSYTKTPQITLLDASTLLSTAPMRTDTLGRFPNFKIAFTGREAGLMGDALRGLEREWRSADDTFLDVRRNDIRQLREVAKTAPDVLSQAMHGGNPAARLVLEYLLMASAQRMVRRDLEIDIRLGEFRDVGWQRPSDQADIEFDRIRWDASAALYTCGFAGAWSHIVLRYAQTDAGTTLLVPALRFLAWGADSDAIAEGIAEIGEHGLLTGPDGRAEAGFVSNAIDDEETMFRAISYASDQRLGLNPLEGIAPFAPRIWGEGVGRSYANQSDVPSLEIDQVGGSRINQLLLATPLTDLIWGDGAGQRSMERSFYRVRTRLATMTPSLPNPP